MSEKNNIEKQRLCQISKYKLSTVLHLSSDIAMVGFSTFGAIVAAKNFTKAITEDNFNITGIGHGIFAVIFTASTIYAGVCAYNEIKDHQEVMKLLKDNTEEKQPTQKVLKR